MDARTPNVGLLETENSVASLAQCEAILREKFPPWVLELEMEIEKSDARGVALRLPWSSRLARFGGILSGASVMAAADAAAVIAISAVSGKYIPMATAQQSTSFQRPIMGKDVVIQAVVTKLGRRMAFVDVTLTPDGSDEAAVRASSVFTLQG